MQLGKDMSCETTMAAQAWGAGPVNCIRFLHLLPNRMPVTTGDDGDHKVRRAPKVIEIHSLQFGVKHVGQAGAGERDAFTG